jgi:hypothetical protein
MIGARLPFIQVFLFMDVVDVKAILSGNDVKRNNL